MNLLLCLFVALLDYLHPLKYPQKSYWLLGGYQYHLMRHLAWGGTKSCSHFLLNFLCLVRALCDYLCQDLCDPYFLLLLLSCVLFTFFVCVLAVHYNFIKVSFPSGMF